MIDLVLFLVLAAIAGSIIFYLVREKKRGVTCVGCPYARDCAKAKQGGCSCHSEEKAITAIKAPLHTH